ncbi:hypothetical protein TRFO_24365 [Tritrichomonas foetus]|uniref:Heparinase II/III-like C-terminal domain-containing protein n=1 Tax=Tritrichomonas foetus TaxID=1144522 RepID=A0A1J4K7Q7_9EUKA|nr:hypothetical protein TRFO_24365 [Tritrichomonas foetus]|eukprot:OHT07415.1 hypothetical protein TRFO_24365 [Tritrichomonas foetus]
MIFFFLTILTFQCTTKWDKYISSINHGISNQKQSRDNSHVHPRGMFNRGDLERAKENVKHYEWAQARNRTIMKNAENYLSFVDGDKLENLLSYTTPGSYTFCPNCVLTGKNWHPNGNWKWDHQKPDEITCNVCGMKFPNEKYPESIKYTSTFDSRQVFSYVDEEPVMCMSYSNCRSSPSAFIRGKKVSTLIDIYLKNIALGHAVSGNITFANAVKRILLRFSEVLPTYLVYSGYSYNEYADCDPHIAAEKINELPSQCKIIASYGNNLNNGKLYSGYWSASRLGLSGMDGILVKELVTAYDLTENSGVYSEEEKKKIIENVILEASFLGYCDDSINNKAVFNRAAVGLSGVVVGSSELANFGIDGFLKTINEYFLKDGGFSESPAYGIMTLNGLEPFSYAYRDYTDQTSLDKYSHFNVNYDTNYYQIWQALMWTVQGDLLYPPIADSYQNLTLSQKNLDLIKVTYPTEDNLKFVIEKSQTESYYLMFYQEPSVGELSYNELFNVPDMAFPYLAQAYLRTGQYGRDSTVILDASPYGSHHHLDSLNLIYWKDGHELLNDLGYLWDHVDVAKTKYTNVHNTVVIDGNNQMKNHNGGSIHFFGGRDGVKIVSASSKPYPNAEIYHRTVTQIEHDNNSYIVDIFRVKGGTKREYVFHGVHNNYHLNSDLKFTNHEEKMNVRFCVQWRLPSVGWIEISDASLREEFFDETLGSEFAEPFPTKIDESTRTDPNVNWSYYPGNDQVQWESVPGKTTQGVRFHATEKADTGGIINVNLYLGNTQGINSDTTFIGKMNARYRVSFWLRGNLMPIASGRYWKPGIENKTGRVECKIHYQENPENSETEWKFYTGYFDIGTRKNEKFGGETSKEWNIVWNIDNDYTFTAYFPAREKQQVYYTQGWGQRYHTNTDKGVTLPYFYIYDFNEEGQNDFSTFVAVYEGSKKDKSIIKGVSMISMKENGNVGIEIKTKNGNDYILSSFDNNKVEAFDRTTAASVAVELYNGTIILENGSEYTNRTIKLKNLKSAWSGTIDKYQNDANNSYIDLQGFDLKSLHGQSIHITTSDGIERCFPIFNATSISGGSRIYTRYNSNGFKIVEGGSWNIPNFVNLADTEKGNTNNDDNEHDLKSNAGIMTGIVIGVVSGCGVLVLIVVLFIKKKRQNSSSGKMV